MVRGAWRAAVCGVTKGPTFLSDFHFTLADLILCRNLQVQVICFGLFASPFAVIQRMYI